MIAAYLEELFRLMMEKTVTRRLGMVVPASRRCRLRKITSLEVSLGYIVSFWPVWAT